MDKPRIWRYEVIDVWGSMEGRIEVGTVVLDRWKSDRAWMVLNAATGEHGGWSGRLLGEASEDAANTVRENWRRRREERLASTTPGEKK